VKYFQLVWAALFRRKTRTTFTLLSVLAAFLLFGLLNSVRSAFTGASNSVAGASRLITVSKISMTMSLPKSLLERIEAQPGIAEVTYANWFGGIYQDPKNFFPSQAVANNFLDLYPEWELSTDQRKAFHDIRTGAIVGASLAEKYHWKIGDKVPLQAALVPQKDGSSTWTFDLVGIYRVADPNLRGQENNFYFNWNYLDEARQIDKGTVGWYVIKLADRNAADQVAGAVDALSFDSDHETKTESEQAFTAAFAGQFGDIGLIVGAIIGAVFFTLVLLSGNTMAQAVRERVPELAILKTLGFTNRGVLALVLAESVLLLVLGGVVGLALAGVVVNALRTSLPAMGPTSPMVPVGSASWIQGLCLMVVVGLIVGALPAVRGMRLKIVDALSGR
jgi:putative ABC transport system permease protein